MENEEVAALRATLRAAELLPARARARQARLSAQLADGDDLLPYVLAPSCSDPRDRVVSAEDLGGYQVLEGGVDQPAGLAEGPQRYEPSPFRPFWLVVAAVVTATLWLLSHTLSLLLLTR